MIIGIANDHHGIELKKNIINYLNDKNIKYINYGTDSLDNIDYVDYAKKLCDNISSFDLGILICGTGIGMSIAANKIKGIRCARIVNAHEAHLAREHNAANVIALAEYTNDIDDILFELINTFPSTEERHVRRVNKIMDLEN